MPPQRGAHALVGSGKDHPRLSIAWCAPGRCRLALRIRRAAQDRMCKTGMPIGSDRITCCPPACSNVPLTAFAFSVFHTLKTLAPPSADDSRTILASKAH